MRKILLFFLLASPVCIQAQTSLVNQASGGDQSGAAHSTISTGAFNLSAGNLLVVTVRWFPTPPTISSVTDLAGNTFTSIVTNTTCATPGAVQMFYAKNTIANAADVVTANFSAATATYVSTIVRQFSGFLTTTPLDTSAQSSEAACASTGTHAITGTFTTTSANEMIYVVANNNHNPAVWAQNDNGTSTADALIQPSDGPVTNGPLGDEYRFVSAIQTGQTDFMDAAQAGVWSTVMATFKAAGTVSPTPLSSLDQYQCFRGVTAKGDGGTGFFRVFKISARWIFSCPNDNVYYRIGMQVIANGGSTDNYNWYGAAGTTMGTRTNTVYGSNAAFIGATLTRMAGWGFNGIGFYQDVNAYPWNSSSPPPVKMPSVDRDQSLNVGTTNNSNRAPQPVKSLFGYTDSSVLLDGAASTHPDFYDPQWAVYAKRYLYETADPANTPYNQNFTSAWSLGFSIGDTDYLVGIGPGLWSQAANNSIDGVIAPHPSGLILAGTPVQAAMQKIPNAGSGIPLNALWGFDATNPAKTAWLAYICGGGGVYATVGALNTAWGSSYTTCGTSGTQTNGQAVGTGNAVTTTFAATLAHTAVISKKSIVIKVALPAVTITSINCSNDVNTVVTAATDNLVLGEEVAIAGDNVAGFNGNWSVASIVNGTTFTYNHTDTADCGSVGAGGTVTPASIVAGSVEGDLIYGPALTQMGAISGTINRTTGALSVTFATAPPNTVAITADSCAGCWGIGTGLSDENGSNAIFGTSSCAFQFGPFIPVAGPCSGISATILADMDGYLYNFYFKGFNDWKTQFRVFAPNILAWGPNVLNGHAGLSRPNIIKAADAVFDVIFAGFLNQTQIDTWALYGPNKPLVTWEGWLANQDSFLSAGISSISRSGNTVTITTNNAHRFTSGASASVLVRNVVGGATSFNGTFSNLTVADTTHISYVQNGPNESGSGGIAGYPCPASGNPLCDTTQQARATRYVSHMEFLKNATVTATGTRPIVGFDWWQLADNWGEGSNYGWLDLLGNPYDCTNSSIAHTTDENGHPSGGEAANWGCPNSTSFVPVASAENASILAFIKAAFSSNSLYGVSTGRLP